MWMLEGKTGQYLIGWCGWGWAINVHVDMHTMHTIIMLGLKFKRSPLALANYLDATLTGSSLALATRPKASLVGAHRWNRLHMEENQR